MTNTLHKTQITLKVEGTPDAITELLDWLAESDEIAQRFGTTAHVVAEREAWNTCDTALCPRPVFPNFDSTFCNEHQEYENE